MFIEVIKESFRFFPLIAFIFTIPYILHCYHKYGTVFSFRIVIIYSLVLYLMTAYFLVILPLPSIEAVSKMQGPKCQLIPFTFVKDIIKEYNKHLSPIYLNKALLQILFNVFMTMPFGIYLRYYFKFSFKKTFVYSFLLSLFFELTQLSGLFFFYPRPYRLFDVDDLLSNTLGGVIGYIISKPLMMLLPSREKIDLSDLKASKKVSLLRMLCALGIDTVIIIILFSFMVFFIEYSFEPKDFILVILIYHLICPLIFNSKTPGKAFVHLEVRDQKNNSNRFRTSLNALLTYLFYYHLPILLIKYVHLLAKEILIMEDRYRFIAYAVTAVSIGLFYLIEMILIIFHKESLAYRITKTKNITTL